MIQKNKVSSYFLYAVGEVFLVVIGILIAVGINNWNEDKKTDIKQRKQLELIRNEMANNLDLLENESDKLNIMLSKQLQLIALMNSKMAIDTISEKAFALLFYGALNDRIETPVENSALNELLASGDLKDIKNDSISNMLISWDNRLLKLKAQENTIYETTKGLLDFQNTLIDFSFRRHLTSIYPDFGVDEPTNKKSNKSILFNQVFENMAILVFGQNRLVYSQLYPQYKKDLIHMINVIDEELNKR